MAILPKTLRRSPTAGQKSKRQLTGPSSHSSHRSPAERTISASQAKTHLLSLLTELDDKREPVIITKRGRPIARIVPIQSATPRSIFGCMKGTFKITGDIVGPEADVWDALR